MAAQGNRSQPSGFAGRPERTDIPTPDTLAGRDQGLGLDDLSDEERAAIDTLSGQGGLGFDDLTDAERLRLAEQGPVHGGLGLDDALTAEVDDDDYRAA